MLAVVITSFVVYIESIHVYVCNCVWLWSTYRSACLNIRYMCESMIAMHHQSICTNICYAPESQDMHVRMVDV